MIHQYSICQAVDEPEHSVHGLIRHAMKAIADEAKDTPIELDHFYLEQPNSSGNLPAISYQFSDMTDEQIEFRDNNIKWTKQEKISSETQEIEYIGGNDSMSKLQGLLLRLPQGENQYDGILLTEKLASLIQGLGDVKVHDFVYHQFSDRDAIDHPYFTLYYSQ
jgi:hypothetical protein